VVVTNLTLEVMVTNVINQPIGVVVKLNAIVKICKYKRLHERHHFILMAMEVHDARRCDMDHFIMKCARLFHDRLLKDHQLLYFCICFFKQCLSIGFQCALTFAIKRKIVLVGDAYSKPPITIRPHD